MRQENDPVTLPPGLAPRPGIPGRVAGDRGYLSPALWGQGRGPEPGHRLGRWILYRGRGHCLVRLGIHAAYLTVGGPLTQGESARSNFYNFPVDLTQG